MDLSGYYVAIIDDEEEKIDQATKISLKFEPVLKKFRDEMNEIFTDFAKDFKQFQYYNQYQLIDEPNKFQNEFKKTIQETIKDINDTSEEFQKENNRKALNYLMAQPEWQNAQLIKYELERLV